MDYLHVKALHVTAVAISVSLFVTRFSLSLTSIAWRRQWLLRVAPHINDTVLLASALWLCLLAGQWPGASGWLTAKVLALLLYIVAGSVALRFGRAGATRGAAFVVALLCVVYMIGAAVRHSPWSWFYWISATVSHFGHLIHEYHA